MYSERKCTDGINYVSNYNIDVTLPFMYLKAMKASPCSPPTM